MGCRDWEGIVESADTRYATERAEKAEKRNDELSKFLCGMLDHLEASEFEHFIDRFKGLRDWWEEHKKLDAQQLERLKSSALAKLTPDEKKALGLDHVGR